MSDHRFPPPRALLRSAAIWGVAWGAAGSALFAAIGLFDPNPAIESLPERLGMALLAGVSWGVRFALIGAVIGAIFAVVVRLSYRGRRLADISPFRFALLGAVVGAVGVPLFLQAMNVLSGGAPIAWHLVVDDARWAAVFGAVVAAGSILLARRADALPRGPRSEQIQSDDDLDRLRDAERQDTAISQGERSARS